jgi:hypothetical protein
MQSLLDRLVDAEEASGSPIRRYLRPGRPEGEIQARFDAVGLRAPTELLALYGWRDGTDQAAWLADVHRNNLCLFPFARFTPLDEAISDYIELKSIWQSTPWYENYIAGNDPGWGYWRSEWFPVFQSDKSRHVVDCLLVDVGPVWHVYFEPFPRTEPRHPSLSELTRELTELIEKGDCFWSAERQHLTDNLDYDF